MVTVMFDCKKCGLKQQKVQVPARETEDVVKWVEKVRQLCGDEHLRLSPTCNSEKVDLYLPVPPEAEFIGQQNE